ncbi:MAG: ATP-binding cassette domain-containing protein, partial [Acholeplasmatales bacterium]|nr:ATP-binding cassette domain-containing protein [Acholeplasmatales bacterium]
PEKAELPTLLTGYEYVKNIAKLRKCDFPQELFFCLNAPLFKTIVTLSKGNKQKITLIAALCGNPQMLVLDEPLSGLDSLTKDILVKLITKVYLENNMCIVISTHEKERFTNIQTKTLDL